MDEKQNINITIRDFKKSLAELINGSGLPGFLIYEILNGLTQQINAQIQAELNEYN